MNEIKTNSWVSFLSARFTSEDEAPALPEPVYGPNGSRVDGRATVHFEIKNPETGLWRNAECAFPGEEFRVSFRSISNTGLVNTRQDYEKWKAEDANDRLLYAQARTEKLLQVIMRSFYWLIIIIAGKVGMDLGFMIFQYGFDK